MPAMGEDYLATLPYDRAAQQAVVTLKKGAYLLKCGRRGKTKFCPFRLSADEKFLIWYSRQQEKHLKLSSVTKIIQGQRNTRNQRQILPEKECQSLSLIHANGEHSLDLICKDKAQAITWFIGLKAAIYRCHHPIPYNSLRSCTGVHSCVSSPAGFIRRKHNLGLLEDNTEYDKVHSVCGSPSLSLSERCFSDGLSYTSDSVFSSESILSNMHNIMDINYPYTDPYNLKSSSIYSNMEYEKNVPNRFITSPSSLRLGHNSVLKEVMVWGEGIERGILWSGAGRSLNYPICQGEATLPKLLESTMMLDVHNISLGGKHAALVTRQGEVFCWGQGKGGKLGHKVDMDVTSPKIVDSLIGVHIKYVACGEYNTCALTDSGEVYMWGDDCGGIDLAGEEIRSPWIPHKLSGALDGIRISHVACGEWHTAILSSCGRLFTYGDGTFGVLGHGNLLSISHPKEVESLRGLLVRSVSCGSWHTAAIVEVMVDHLRYKTASAKLFTWGDSDGGRLGHDDMDQKLLPTCVAQLVDYDFVQVSCGRMMTIALTNLGRVFTMGSTMHGQLGNPQAKDKSITIVEGDLKQEFAKEISSGSYHVAVLTSSGSVYTWGKGANGQLGLGDIEDRASPCCVEALRERKVESIACGSSFTAAICLHKPMSISDQSTCSRCKLPFGFMRKKHNCYNCGLLFCRACCGKKVVNASLAPNKSKAFRVCDTCYCNHQRSTYPDKVSKSGNYGSEQLMGHHNTIPHQRADRNETPLDGKHSSLKQSCGNRSLKVDSKEFKKQEESQMPLETVSVGLGEVPRWGQVSCPVLFRAHCSDNSAVNIPDSIMKLPSVATSHLESSKSSMPNGVKEVSKSHEMLIEEVQRLRNKARSLEEQCEIRNHKIQECQQKVEESWLLARQEARKCKGAKEVIKALTLRLHEMMEKVDARREENDGFGVSLPYLTPVCTDIFSPKGSKEMSVTRHLPPEVALPKDCRAESLRNSPIVFSDSLRSKHVRNRCPVSKRSAEDPCVTQTDPQQDKTKESKHEWVEQYEAGVYITFTILPTGQKGLKRVKFSRKRFSEKAAEKWLEENQAKVCEKYDMEGYSSSAQSHKG